MDTWRGMGKPVFMVFSMDNASTCKFLDLGGVKLLCPCFKGLSVENPRPALKESVN